MMFKTIWLTLGLIALVTYAISAVSKEDAEFIENRIEQLDRQAMEDRLGRFFDENSFKLEKLHVALECAALATRFDQEENARLFSVAYNEGQEVMPPLLITLLSEGPEADFSSMPWKDMPYNNMRELVAVSVGQKYGNFEEAFSRDIPLGDSVESWKDAYRLEFNTRNCSLIGR